MVCIAPRAQEDSVRPRRPAGVVARPLNFTVRRPGGKTVPPANPSAERWRTPRWFLLAAVPVLAALVPANAGVIYFWLHDRGSSRGSLPLLITINSAIVLLLLVRSWKAVVARASSSRGTKFSSSDSPSNNRWRDP